MRSALSLIVVLVLASLDAHASARKVTAPLQVTLAVDESSLRVNRTVAIAGTVRPTADMGLIALRVETEGPVVVDSAPPAQLYHVTAGREVPFSFTVRYVAAGHATVHVWADPVDANGAPRWSRRGSLYSLIRGERGFASRANPQVLERRAIAEDVRVGRVKAEQGVEMQRELRRVRATVETRAPRFRTFTQEEERLNSVLGATPRGEAEGRMRARSSSELITVQGNVRWTDENGDRHPVVGATVMIMDEDDDWDEEVAAVVTDIDGNYHVKVDNDDDPFSDRDIYVEIRAENNLVDTQTEDDYTYIMSSEVYDETPDGTVLNLSFTASNSGLGPSFSIFQAATWIAAYAQHVNGGMPLDRVEVIWPCDEDGSHYDSFSENVNMTQADRWDWDTVHHEYGHHVQQELSIANNPGGDHSIGECSSVVNDHDKDEGVRLAWGEAWPTFFGTSGQQVMNMAALGVPRVGDLEYQDLEDTNLTYSLEAQTSDGAGEDNELAVQRVLWDLYDSADDGRDTVSRSDVSIWNSIKVNEPETFSEAWTALRAGQNTSRDLAMGEIAADHGIGPTIQSPNDGEVVTLDDNENKRWFSFNANVGCDLSRYAGDLFEATFYTKDSLTPIFTLPVFEDRFFVTEEMFETLAATGKEVIWSAQAHHVGEAPGTGPYRGDNALIVLNRPPVANAGADKTAECSSAGRTPVQLNGSGSSDPDGDTLSYEWTAPGVVFDSRFVPNPTGNFPQGTTTVTLEVTDGHETRTDTVQVTVQDTTPPVLSCPAEITVECTGNSGVNRSDPQLTAFFAGATATDLCDTTPTITHNAPSFLPVGITPVTFTARDDAGNTSTCVVNVTVRDTQLPSIAVTLDQVQLWAPNHKFVTVNAAVTVTDLCDPNPTFRLISITSSDDSSVRGTVSEDIAGAEFGTADTTFQLRAERIANRPPRRYTITYRGLDSSMNMQDTLVYVDVPHDQGRR